MADCPGHPRMVLYVLKNDPTLRDLKHIQVDGPRMAYLFFFDKQGHQRLTFDAAQAMRAHVGEAFTEWISHSAHFAGNPLPLAVGWCHAVAASEQCRHWSQAEYQGHPVLNLATSKSDSTLPLVGSAPPSTLKIGPAEDTGSGWAARPLSTQLWGRPPKTHPAKDGAVNLPPSSPD